MKTHPIVLRFFPIALAAALITPAFAQTPAASPAQQAETFYRQGLAAEQAGDPDAATKAYENALRLNPRHANARYRSGQVKIHGASIAAKGREAKFGEILVPEIKLDAATLKESLDALQIVVEKQSQDSVSPNFIIQDPKNSLADAKISLVLKNTPARGVLKYMLAQAGAKARYDEHAIVILPN